MSQQRVDLWPINKEPVALEAPVEATKAEPRQAVAATNLVDSLTTAKLELLAATLTRGFLPIVVARVALTVAARRNETLRCKGLLLQPYRQC